MENRCSMPEFIGGNDENYGWKPSGEILTPGGRDATLVRQIQLVSTRRQTQLNLRDNRLS